MRNFLTSLTLCFVLLASASSVNAEIFDDSKRSERLGLSFYDGRPMYFLYVARPNDRPYYPLYLRAERVQAGDDISNFPNYSKGVGYVIIQGTDSKDFILYGYNNDGKLEYLSNSGDPDVSAWMQEALTLYGDSAIAQASAGDIGVSVFDAIAERVKTWVLAGLIFAGGYCCVKFGFREMLRFAGTGLGGKSGAASLTSASSDVSDDRKAKAAERENFEAFRRSWDAIRELGEADAYATGEAFGLTFTAKVVNSNQILQESWSRLSEEERQFLTNEARALAWQDDLIDEKERIYRQTVMGTALGDLEGVDASTMYSNPYGDETSEDVDDPEPVPRPNAAPLPYLALEEEEEDDGLSFPGEATNAPKGLRQETYDDYDAANRALDESYYDDEGGYW